MSPLDEIVERLRAGDLQGAESGCRALLKRAPRRPDALHLLGCVHLQRGHHEQAIRLIGQAVRAAPVVPSYHENLAEAYYQSGALDRAETECQLALRLDASAHRPLNLMGLIARDRCDYEQAIRWLSAALEARKPNLHAMINMAAVLNRTGDYELAANYSRLALKLAPDHTLAWNNLGMSLKGLQRLGEAREAFANAGELPLARFNLGYTLMLEDDLAGGLPLLETRKRLLGIGRGLSRPEWRGTPEPKKTLLVIHEQGLGDTLLTCRFYPWLAERCAQVVALVQPPLERLIAAAFPGVRVVTELDGVAYDLWCAHMSLPLLLGVDAADKIPKRPWIELPGAVARRERPRVGLNWAGNPRFSYDRVRSTRLEKLADLLEVTEVEWCSLHKGHREDEAEEFGLPQPLADATDFLDTARVVRDLDLVISTETAIPNLSAAIGVRTCVLASTDCDWRWKSWYPGVTICRQDAPGDWPSAVAKARDALRELLAPAR